jgi:hypothetical protein
MPIEGLDPEGAGENALASSDTRPVVVGGLLAATVYARLVETWPGLAELWQENTHRVFDGLVWTTEDVDHAIENLLDYEEFTVKDAEREAFWSFMRSHFADFFPRDPMGRDISEALEAAAWATANIWIDARPKEIENADTHQ